MIRRLLLALGLMAGLAGCGLLRAPSDARSVEATMTTCSATVPEPEASQTSCVSIAFEYVPRGDGASP